MGSQQARRPAPALRNQTWLPPAVAPP
jgi:hypothetical protein